VVLLKREPSVDVRSLIQTLSVMSIEQSKHQIIMECERNLILRHFE
jgi:hypothetical protein